jgi:RNA recognition motif-containing protein
MRIPPWGNGRTIGQELQVKIYVGNLSKEMTEAQLNELMLPFGTPESTNIATDRGTGASRGFGFVQFANDDHAKAAIAALDKKEVMGMALTVNEARPPKQRT